MDFAEWLIKELRNRGWTQADLARESGLTSGGIAHLVNRTRNPTAESCKVIARALRYPPEIVFRAAGLLPPKPAADAIIEQAEHIINGYKSPETKNRALAYLEFLRVEEEKAEYRAKPARRFVSAEPK